MDKEEIEEIETLEIDFKDTDELELALEVSFKKAIYLIDDLIKHLFELQQENQELKLELSGYRQAILEDKDMLGLKEESEELKKQLEEYQLQNIDLRADIMIQKKAFPNKLIKDKTFYDLYDMPTYEDLLNQQKEFIEYLTSYIDLLSNKPDLIEESEIDLLKEILSKYKSILGEHNG